jgi:hypothetical protein
LESPTQAAEDSLIQKNRIHIQFREEATMSKESAILFLRELRTNEKAKELLQGREKPKNKDDALKVCAEITAELGEDISPEDFAGALEEIEAKIHQRTEAVSADMQELEDDDLGDVAGGAHDSCSNTVDWSDCDTNDFCYINVTIYWW